MARVILQELVAEDEIERTLSSGLATTGMNDGYSASFY
jgi:hypothetical protein